MKTRTQNPLAGRSLTATLAIAFLALSVVVLLISGGLQIFSNIQTQQGVIANRQQLIAQEAARTVGSFIQEKFSILETTVRLADPATASPEVQKQILQSLLSIQLPFRQLVLLNAQGQELAKVSRLSLAASGQLADQLTRDVLVQIQEGKRYISPVYIDPVTSEPLVIMAVPETNALKEFQGTLVAEVNLKVDLWDLVDQLKVSEAGLAYVVDRQGNLIAFSDISRVLRGENVSNLDQVNEFINNPAPIDETGVDTFIGITGASVIGTYVPLGTPDWAVVTEVPWTETYGPVIQSTVISVIVMLVVAVLAGWGGAYLARRLSAPVIGLTDTATRISAGEMNLRAAEEGASEVVSLARAFNSMTDQLRELIRGLEARTRALETSTEVSRRLSTILDREQLVAEVVRLVQSAFNYYHVHIYLIDETTQDLVMAGGTGEAGRIMLASGHRIEPGKGLTGRAAATNNVVLVPDISQEEGWLPNPLLPDTRAEVAIPISIGERVLGVLDVQHNVTNGLSGNDANLLASIANQVAIALQNTRLFTEAQKRARYEERVNLITQRIQSTTTVEEALQISIRELGRMLDAETLVRLRAGSEPDDDSAKLAFVSTEAGV